ncbi:ATP-binding protein [Anaerotruncus colihominis]|uniref:ATP-binding protein n=1 Tax=Anaerotruncus colihominis TaxID=169435 RepID=UPI000B393003|nr:ATP-binding protein [Anaerotruncus colihominis]OUO67223.1 hypothetical protein B5F55_09815 [Anaerotruncus colihominis]
MKKRVFWSLCSISVLMVLLTAALTLRSYYAVLLGQAQRDLADDFKLVARSIDFTRPDEVAYLQSLGLQFDSFRITMISPDGTVLFDTDNDSASMENHLERPEVAAALDGRTGSDVRHSDTMGMDTVYYAGRLSDGTVLRVSKQTRSVGAAFAAGVPVMLVIVAAAIAICLFVSSRLTRRLLRPIEALADNLEQGARGAAYEELEPFFAKIREQNRLIQEQVKRLREERDTINTITSNMKEGMVLLDLERGILSVNHSALMLLDAAEGVYEGKNILNLSRSELLGDCAGKALAGAAADAVLERDGRACHIFASPVRDAGGAICGAIVLLLDVTEQQRAEQVRRDFAANVSHELKTPLTSISGFAEMMENGMADNSQDVRRFAGRIYTQAQRLIALTDDIIRLSRIERADLTENVPVELRALCDRAVETLRFTAEQKQVEIAVTGGSAPVRGDRQMLDELITNLVDNAVKYNRPGGRVDVSLSVQDGLVCLRVADTGIGIPKEHQERIFERFYRVDQSRSKQTGGTGLGLSIVKHVVERHGGSITLESVPGEGTAVTVRLPADTGHIG